MTLEVEKKKEAILRYLEREGKCFTKEIAEGVGISAATVSKYLLVLESEKKIKREEKPPYVYYEKMRSSGG